VNEIHLIICAGFTDGPPTPTQAQPGAPRAKTKRTTSVTDLGASDSARRFGFVPLSFFQAKVKGWM
jgi:hypothetical protein